MSDKSQKSRIAADWKRPAGPLNVWRQLEAEERLAGGTTRRVRISIQDVPEDRYDEAIEHMLEYFIADEASCQSLKLKEDKDTLEDFRWLWKTLLNTGVSVGAFKLDSDGKLSDLAGINILFVATEATNKLLADFTVNVKFHKTRKLFEFMHSVSENVDVCKIYQTDKYLTAMGLSVSPAYRGQRLGVRLLEARTDIGRKYGLVATSTVFSGPSSQLQAERAGFETNYSKDYSEVFDDDGQLLFPNIKSKCMKLMTKRLQ